MAASILVANQPVLAWPADAACTLEDFQKLVGEKAAGLYRDLAWRHTFDPYEILVSEVMLQQTQVKRVAHFWPAFLEKFPTVDALAAASVSDVLEAWQGLGYNRRALMLKRAAEACAADFGGVLPLDEKELRALPGVGPATAAGVLAFSSNIPVIYLETNVRSVFIHHLYPDREGVTDRELIGAIAAACPAERVRDWYYGLLDYGSYLKGTLPNPSRRSAHHQRQSQFEGSRRQKRSWMLQELLSGCALPKEQLFERVSQQELDAGRDRVDSDLLQSILDDLISEGFIVQTGELLALSD